MVGGVTPGKGGQVFEGKVPVFDTVYEARKQTGCNATMIFVPPPFCADAILEAEAAGVAVIIAITEGTPVIDMGISIDLPKRRAEKCVTDRCCVVEVLTQKIG